MYFGVNETFSWPRGFPLDRIRDERTSKFKTCDKNIIESEVAVVQSLANHEPDVDGIYRLTRQTPFNFTNDKAPLVIPTGSFTPFNAQATMWYKKAFMFMLLPTTVHGRVSDIWRSYITEYFLSKIGGSVIFTKPYAFQDRNAHSYLGDFQSEIPLNLQAPGLVEYLQTRPMGGKELHWEILDLYVDLYERGILQEEDVTLITMWLKRLGVFNFNQ